MTNHLLPKGTKSKVNLEEQGRQKISFSFTQTKKTRQNLFLAPPSLEENDHSDPPQAGTVPTTDLVGHCNEIKNVDVNTSDLAAEGGESQTTHPPVSFALKSRHDLGKMHFKKQILSVTVVEDNSIVSTASGDISEPVVPSESDKIRSPVKVGTETSLQQDHKNSVIDSSSEKVINEENPQENLDSCLKGSVSSHIGKGDTDSSAISEHEENRKSQTRSDCTLPGSESDGDSIRTSSSQKSSDRKNINKSESHSNETKILLNSKVEESEKSRSDRREDEKRSSRSKSERDSRHTSSRSSRSDRDRRRTKSRSRSRSRGCRTISYSRSERSRGDRQSRSDRSHYHDSERRFHRSSPHRERRNSRSRGDGRLRDSSDSEDDHRRMRTRGSDSSRSSNYSNSQKDSKSSTHSRSHRDSKSMDCSRSSESDKRTQHSKSERSNAKTGDSESNKKSSSEADVGHRKSSAQSNSDINAKTSNSNLATSSRTSERRVQKNIGTSDSDEEHRKKSQSQASDRTTRSSSSKKTDSDHKTSNNITGTERQSTDRLSYNKKQSRSVSSQLLPQRECRVYVELLSESSIHSKYKYNSQQIHEETHKTTDQQAEHQNPIQNLCSMENSTDVSETQKNVEVLTESNSICIEVESSIKIEKTEMEDETPFQSETLSEEQTDPVVLHTPDQDPVGSLSDPLSVKESPPGGCLKLNTKLDGSSLNIINISMPVTPSTYEKGSEQLNVKSEQPSCGNVKKDSSSKKSRWDIVGQDSLESQSPKTMASPETVASVKEVILEKKIEVISETNPDETELLSSKSVERLERNETCLESCQQVSTQISDHDTQSTIGGHVQPLVDQNLVIPSNSAPFDVPLNCGSANTEKLNVDKPLSKTQDPDSLNCDNKCHSEDSESEESDSDSDDEQVSLKRLHSVVVVPKNSTIALEAKDFSETSSGSLVQQKPSDTGEPLNMEFGYSFNSQSKHSELSASHFKTGKRTATLLADFKCQSASAFYQSQSDTVDSTSHPEATHPHMDKNWTAQESIYAQTSVQNFEMSCRQPESGHHQYHDRPDSWNGRKGGKQLYNDLDLSGGKGYSLAWDLNHSEQPTSTFQQPDSSHGHERLPHPGIAAAFDIVHGQGQWAQPVISKTSNSVNMHVPAQYHDSVNQIHPDSLTNDHDEDCEGRVVGIKRVSVPTVDHPGSSPFVQAHEISSNCSFIPDVQSNLETPKEDNQKPHRGRGPPKKRRQDFESESDNEAEAGLTSKKECFDESSRGLKDGKELFDRTREVPRPLLSLKNFHDPAEWREKAKQKKMPPYFDLIEENLYLTER